MKVYTIADAGVSLLNTKREEEFLTVWVIKWQREAACCIGTLFWSCRQMRVCDESELHRLAIDYGR